MGEFSKIEALIESVENWGGVSGESSRYIVTFVVSLFGCGNPPSNAIIWNARDSLYNRNKINTYYKVQSTQFNKVTLVPVLIQSNRRKHLQAKKKFRFWSDIYRLLKS